MPRDHDALYDILDASQLIATYIRDMDYPAFQASPMARDAVIRRLEIIGEATKRLTNQFQARHPEIPGEDMAGTRDRVIHGYDTVDSQIV